MIKKLRLGFGVVLALSSIVGVTHSASADPITTLFSTGAGFSEGQVDTNWVLTGAIPGGYSSALTVASSASFPFPIWVANDATSKWLVPNAAQDNHVQNADYNNTTTFSLAGFDSTSAAIAFDVATDNQLSDVILNNHSLVSEYGYDFSAVDLGGFKSFAFADGAAFVGGTNTLTFVVHNLAGTSGNPTGLNVKISGTASVVAVPEAGTLALLGSGVVLGLGIVARRKR